MSATLTRLETETRAYHADADAVLRDLLAPSATPTMYMQQLVRIYGFEAPLEAALAYTPQLCGVMDIRTRVRSGRVVQDLLALSLSASQITALPQCMIAPFYAPAEALGWLYVIERSMLIHDPVRRHLIARFPQLSRATCYLAIDDDERWNRFAESLEVFARTRALQQQVIAGAHTAFQCAHEWFHGDEITAVRARA